MFYIFNTFDRRLWMSWRDGEIKVGAGDVGQNVVMNMTDPYGFAQIDILQFVNKYPEYPVEWEFSRDTGMDLSGVLNMMNFTKCVREQISAEIRGYFQPKLVQRKCYLERVRLSVLSVVLVEIAATCFRILAGFLFQTSTRRGEYKPIWITVDEITSIVLAAKICNEVHVVIGTYLGNLYNNMYQFVIGTDDTNEVILYKDQTEVLSIPFIHLTAYIALKVLCE